MRTTSGHDSRSAPDRPADERPAEAPPEPVTASSWSAWAAAAAADENWLVALERWDACIAEFGADPPLLMKKARALQRLGRREDAEDVYLALLREKPDRAEAVRRIAELRYERDDQDAAHAFLERAAACGPNLSATTADAGKVAEKAGDLETALRFYRHALSLPSPVDGLPTRIEQVLRKQEYERANELLEKRNLASADAAFRAMLSGDSTDARVLGKLGRIASELDRPEDAWDFYERAVAADDRYSWAYIGQSEILEAGGDLDGAIGVLEAATRLDPSMAWAQQRLELLRRKRLRQSERLEGVRIRHWPADSPASNVAADAPSGPRVAIICWNLRLNSLGRAMVLAELAKPHAACEIVGPIVRGHGEDLWPPVRDSRRDIDISGFHAHSFYGFMEGAVRLVLEKPCDVAWISKPRLPSLIIGFLYKLIHGASIVLDIDDDELAFVSAEQPVTFDDFLSDLAPRDWNNPGSRRWTELAASMVGFADAVTVCNPVLQRKFGGIVLRHARDARLFDEARSKRASLRAEFGFSDSEKVILFLGTPRRHKGLIEVATALKELADPHAVFCIIGTIPDETLRTELESLGLPRLVFHPDQPYSRLAELNALADVVCILQDPDDPVAQSQTPAKLTDALASGTVILATPVPPLRDIIDPGRIVAVSDTNLVEALRAALSTGCIDTEAAAARRDYFRAEFSIDANARRAQEAIKTAQSRNGPVPEDFLRLLRHIDVAMPGLLPPECTAPTKGLLRSSPRVGKLRNLHEGVNLAFFWKANDSSILGRRPDMLLKQFAAMPNIKRILHIDAPISVDKLNALAQPNEQTAQGPGRLIAENTIARFLRSADDDRICRRVFVYRGKETHLLGQELPDLELFPNSVESWLQELGMTDNLMAWVCPVVRQFPDVQRRIGFSFVAADVIDDQRQTPRRAHARADMEKNYRETFASTNAAFANCQSVGEWLAAEGLKTLVVPNGMDTAPDIESWDVPEALRGLPRPIVGYCGRLIKRIDWNLIDDIARARPDWSIVLIGEPPPKTSLWPALSRPNVHLLGVIPYELARRHIASFDVAMIPHERSAWTNSMNPLKLYVYRSLGVPVVATAIANLDDLAGDIRIADSSDGFVSALQEAIEERRIRGRTWPPSEMMQTYSWESRAAKVMEHLDRVFHGE